MTVSSRIKGNVKPVFTLKLGAGSAVSYADDLKSIGWDSDDPDTDDITFAEANTSVATYTFSGTALLSYDADSLYAFLAQNPNADVTLVYGAWGNATPTTTKPHIQVVVNTGKVPGFSREVQTGQDATGADFDFELVAKNTTLTWLTA